MLIMVFFGIKYRHSVETLCEIQLARQKILKRNKNQIETLSSIICLHKYITLDISYTDTTKTADL